MINPQEIHTAVTILRQGGLVAFPTETVYGLGADAKNPDALAKIFQAKQRPMDHPVIVHLADLNQLSDWASVIPESALLLARAFWPGPLTLILKKAPHVSDLVTGKQDTIGLRIPSHPVAQALLQAFGSGLAAPSANRFGHISPTTATAVHEELGGIVDLILDGGQCEVGVESTIVDVSGDHPIILRPGMITAKQIETVLQASVETSAQKNSPRVSGAMESHYAPRTPTYLIKSENMPELFNQLNENDFPLAILSHSPASLQHDGIEWITMPQNPQLYAHEIYSTLRALDKRGFRQLLVETVPLDREWDAIRDRLQRASKTRAGR